MDVAVTCKICNVTKVVRVSQEAYHNWKRGMLIQDAMPKLPAGDRELLISGICETCFDSLFKEV